MEHRIIHQDHDIEIRPLSITEAPALLEAIRCSVTEIGAWLSWCSDEYAMQDAVDFLQAVEHGWIAETTFDCNVVLRESGVIVGSVAVNQVDRLNGRGNLGYWTRTGFAGQGIATRAADAAARFAFKHLGLTRIEIVAQDINTRSQRVAEKIGCKLECVARNRLLFRGEPRDAKVYSLIPTDLQEDDRVH